MDLSNCSFEKVGVAVLVDHNYPGGGRGSRVSSANSSGSKELSAFLKAVAGPGEGVCRWKNQRAIREPSALSPESRILHIYLVCLLAADRHSPGCSLSPAAGALRGPRGGLDLCVLRVPFLALWTNVQCKPQRKRGGR